MAQLFDRTVAVTVGNLRFTDLDCQFRIEKSLAHEPNKCELRIYNLSEDNRAMFEQMAPRAVATAAGVNAPSVSLTKEERELALKKYKTYVGKIKGISCQIDAGYNGDNSTLWLGDLRTAQSVREGPDWVTIFESGDGEKAFLNARVNVGFTPKTTAETAIRTILKAMGIGEGNLRTVLPALLKASARLYPRGTVFNGPAAVELTRLCEAADLEWSIENGAALFTGRGRPVLGTAIRVSSETGMLDSPTVDEEGILSVRILMQPDVHIGRTLVMDSRRIKGAYRIIEATWIGDTSGGDWTIDISAERLG
jgi:hypothetical protein